MRLHKLTIQNFRVFNGIHEFNFQDKSLIIFDGPNGHGKSSLFDSIQWCLTGDIQRYRGTSEHQNFNYLMNSEAFNTLPATMKVEICLNSVGSDVVKITRLLRETKKSSLTKIFINDEEYKLREGNEKIKNILVNTNWIENVGDTSGNSEDIDFSHFFSTSQLLSQDQLRDFIQNTNPKDRFKVLENLLGLKKYGVHFNKYLNELNEILRGKLAENKEILGVLQKEYVQVNTNLQNQYELMKNVGEIPEDLLKQKINELFSGFNISTINTKKIEAINSYSQTYLINIRKKITDEKNLHYKNILLLKNHLNDIKSLPNNTETGKKELNKQLIALKHKDSLRRNGISSSKVKISNLLMVEQKSKEFQSIKLAIQTVKDKRDILLSETEKILNHTLILDLKKQNMDYIGFKVKYSEAKKYLDDLLHSQKIKEYEDIIIDIKEKYKSYQLIKENCQQKGETFNDEIQRVEQRLMDLKREKEYHVTDRINQLVYEVQNYLLNNSSQKNCVVCGNKYEFPEHLHKNIRHQIELSEELRTAIDQKYIKYSTDLKVLEEKVVKVQIELSDAENKLNELHVNHNYFSTEIENLKIAVININLLNVSKEFLKKEIEVIEKFLEEYKITYSLTKSLEKGFIEVEKLQKEFDIQYKGLNNILTRLGKYGKYLDGNLNKLQSKVQILKNYEFRATQGLNVLKQHIDQVEKEIQQLEHLSNARHNKIQQIKNLSPSFNGDLVNLEQTINNYEENYNNLTDLDSSLQLILHQITVFLSQEEFLKNRKRERFLSEKIAECENNEQLFNKLICDIEESKKSHITVQSNLMTTYLAGYSEIIDKLFMQISPHAIYRHVHLVARDGNLYILMSVKSSEEEDLSTLTNVELEARFNASLTFSSGQASVLAVCIFLALNEGQNWTKLKFIGIDDPFQNMDDVNAFSFIDVLSQLSLEKQIFISTHSKEFTALMRAKIGVKEEQIGYINFQSYSGKNIGFKTNCSVLK